MVSRPRVLLVTAWGIIWLLNAYILAPAPVFDAIMADLAVGHAAAGALISFFILPMLLLQMPGGYLIDRWNNRTVVEVATLVLVAAAGVAFLAPTYPILLGARVVGGAATTFIFVPCANLVTRAEGGNPSRRLALFLSAPAAGVALGTVAAPALAHMAGWPSILLAFTLPMVPLLGPFHRAAANTTVGAGAGGLRRYGRALINAQLWIAGAAFAASYGAYIFFTSWMPSFLADRGIVDRFLAGALVGAGAGLGALSRPLGGNVALSPRGRRFPLAISFGGLAAIAAFLFFIGGVGSTMAVVLGAALAQLPFSVYYFYARDLLPQGLQGTALAFMNTTSLVGGFVVPLAVGFLVDLTQGYGAAFVLLGVMALVGLGLVAVLPTAAPGGTAGRRRPRRWGRGRRAE